MMQKSLLILSLMMLMSCSMIARNPGYRSDNTMTQEELINACVAKYVDKHIEIAKALEACLKIYRPVRG